MFPGLIALSSHSDLPSHCDLTKTFSAYAEDSWGVGLSASISSRQTPFIEFFLRKRPPETQQRATISAGRYFGNQPAERRREGDRLPSGSNR
jgi:hypothetical protein